MTVKKKAPAGARQTPRRVSVHPTIAKLMPFAYVGDVEITAGDRNVLREGGETIFDVPSTPDTDAIFVRLLFALLNESALARRAEELVVRGTNPDFRKPPIKTDVIKNAIAKNAACRSAMAYAEFKRLIHREACDGLRKLSEKKPEIAKLWKPGHDPVTLKQVENVLNPRDLKPRDEGPAPPKLGVKLSVQTRRKLVFEPLPPRPKKRKLR
jgi:hypothetical protein